MTVLDVRPDPRSNMVAAVSTTMAKRIQQRAVRIPFTIAMAFVFQSLAGPASALIWLLAFLFLQGLEFVAFPKGDVRDQHGARTALGLIVASNLVFALFAVLLALHGGVVGAAVGVLLIAGALVHAVLASGRSSLSAAAAAGPPVLILVLLPLVMLAGGIPSEAILALGCAGVMLCWAAYGAWRRVSGDIIALDLARQEADRASRVKSDFLTMISHEIRTPLNGVMGMAQSLASDPLTTSQRDRLETLISSGQGLHDMIAEVLDLSRIEAGLLPLEYQSFDLGKVVERSIEPFRAISRAKGLDITVSVCPGLASAYLGDPARVRQVLHNLISNAIQQTDAGGVLVSASRDSEGVRLSVCDSGRSVPESRFTEIFGGQVLCDPPAPRADGGVGLGLGLFMANELVGRMGGSITATHRIPNGLCLTAALPLAIGEPARVEACPSPEMPELPPALRVLAAEDHPVNQKVLALLLEQIDVVPRVVENGLQAVQACRESDWDLVLMDIQMPVLDGVSAARRIHDDARESGRLPPPIIAVTANVMAHQLKDYVDAGMMSCVPKPVEANALFSAMQKALDAATRVPAKAGAGVDSFIG